MSELEQRLEKIEQRITILEKKKAVIRKDDNGYNPKMTFTMPRQSSSDHRKVLVIIDAPNVINTALNEKLKNGEDNPTYFDPLYFKVLLDKYVFIYKGRIDRIWIYTTPDYDQINKYLIDVYGDKIELLLYKNLDSETKKWNDIDNPIKKHLKELHTDLEEEDPRISRILFFSGDADYFNVVGDIVESKGIPFYLISHYSGFSPLWKQLTSVNRKEDLRKLRELLFTYRYYKNETVEENM